jgi:hypothetical protein
MKRIEYLSLFLAIFLSSFETRKTVKLTFKNETPCNFKKLIVNVRGTAFEFTDLDAGKTTRPVKVTATYRYCYARAITSTDTLICQPTDFVGEKLITSGRLLMKLQLLPGGMKKNI